ncbi:MAG: helix-turn-helix transcriptional regulator [Promethearchaeota archaeon]
MKSRKTTTTLIIAILTIVSLVFLSTPQVHALQESQEILLTDMNLKAELGQNCTTIVSIEANVTNIGVSSLDYIDLRIDIRTLNLIRSVVNGTSTNTDLITGDRFIIARVNLPTPLAVDESAGVSLKLSTDQLQEQMTQDMDGILCVNHFIFYLRPLDEIQNLIVQLLLPAHANLETGASAPLFPKPSANFTDGNRIGFIWQTPVLHPGQELAFIVKYQLPTGLLNQAEEMELNLALVGILAAMGGAVAALVFERTPAAIRKLRATGETKLSVVSRQEDQVLALLKKKGGSCLQRDVYEELNLSQSAASMILNTLEERGLIKRFREGRENVIHIIE